MSMRPTLSPSVALLATLATSLLVATASAQINGPPTSVTSPGFGGRAVNGAPASVTSLGPRGYAPGPQILLAPPGNGVRHGNGRHHRQKDSPFLYAFPVPYAVPVPYAADDAAADDDTDVVDDTNDQGGPTVFDRRGSGERSYVPPVRNPPAAHPAAAENDPPADPEPVQPATLLVFKDGHKVELGNYAILGATLFDLTPGHARRIPLADLDLDSTRQQNDERGVVFQLPPSLQAN